MTVKEGEEARLECEVQGNPHPTVSWKKQVRIHVACECALSMIERLHSYRTLTSKLF